MNKNIPENFTDNLNGTLFNAPHAGLKTIAACLTEYIKLSAAFLTGASSDIGVGNPIGVRVGDLKPVQRMKPSDIMLVSQYTDISGFESKKIQYSDFLDCLASDILSCYNAGTMAFEPKTKYAKAEHCHNALYRKTVIKSENIQAPKTHIASFKVGQPGHEDFTRAADINVYAETFQLDSPKPPDVGHVKLIYLKRGVIRPSNSNLILDPDFNGWVYADGSTLSVSDTVRFAEAITKYGSGNSFIVPNLSGFFKFTSKNCDISAIHASHLSEAPKHVHKIQEGTVSGTLNATAAAEISVFNTGSYSDKRYPQYSMNMHGGDMKSTYAMDFQLNADQLDIPAVDISAYTPSDEKQDFKPIHQKIYPMIFIGGQV